MTYYFPQRIKELRTSLGLTHSEFAARIGKSRSTVANYEAGRGKPSNEVIERIMKEYKVTREWLMGEEQADTSGSSSLSSHSSHSSPSSHSSSAVDTAKRDGAVSTLVVDGAKPAPKKRGRKKKSAPISTPVVYEAISAADEVSVMMEEKKSAPKKRGRKKKTTPVMDGAALDDAAPVSAIAEDFMPAPVADAAVSAADEKPAPKKRGRKKKEAAVISTSAIDGAAIDETVEKPAPKKRGRKKKEASVVETPAEEIKPASVVEEISALVEKPAEEQPAPKKRGRKKSTTPEVIVESLMGGQISVSDILSRLPEGADKVYVKPEENKAYFTIDNETQSIDLW